MRTRSSIEWIVSSIALGALLIGCQATPPVKPIQASSSGETVLHSPSKDAVQIGDNSGNIDDIRHIRKTYYGSKYKAPFLLNEIPAQSLTLDVNASSVVNAAQGFVCEANIYINGQAVGKIMNGDASYDIDRSALNLGTNELVFVSESCKTATGDYTSGIDDILLISVKLNAT